MNTGKTVFSQLIDFLPLHDFRKCVKNYQGDYKIRQFSCLDQFLSMAFAQLTYRESLRDIEVCLRSMKSKLYHMGFRCSHISRTTIADANEKRDWRIYADFAQSLISIAKKLYLNEKFAINLNETVYALDSSIITLCLSLFPWSYYQKGKGGIKIHTLLDLRGNIPSFIKITNAKLNDFEVLDDLPLEPGSFYIMDRGYIDLSRLYSIALASAFFITRSKRNINMKRLYSRPVDKSTGLRCDQTIVFTGRYSAKDYPEKLRRIQYLDLQNNQYYTFLTNNFILPAYTITELYHCRWQIELFFKWIKQHLRIKKFYGTSENAIKIQIWIAISVYVLVAIIKKKLKLEQNLYTILQILSVTIFEKVDILQLFTDNNYIVSKNEYFNQLELFKL
ncbi:IS4 family transposase [bacterium]|nr:IS4 family transposase [bacterium]MBU1855150.1 IS4 family transposase [Nanoarchaeota archaeon]